MIKIQIIDVKKNYYCSKSFNNIVHKLYRCAGILKLIQKLFLQNLPVLIFILNIQHKRQYIKIYLLLLF